MDMDRDALLELSNYLYERIISFLNKNILRDYKELNLFNDSFKVASGFLLSSFEDYAIFGDYAYVTPQENKFLLTFNLVNGFYPGPNPEERQRLPS